MIAWICVFLISGGQPDTTAINRQYDQLIALQEAYINELEADRQELLQLIARYAGQQQDGLSAIADSLALQTAELNRVQADLQTARQNLNDYQQQVAARDWLNRLLWGGSGLLAGLLIGLLIN